VEEVQKTFREIAERYDRYRRKLIPCFDGFYASVVAMVPFPPEGEFRVLDLGAGTGLLTQFLRERFPKARYTLIDFTAEMLDKARQRFAEVEGMRYLVADYAAADWEGPYDLIVSSLSIHHLSDAAKRGLYRKAFANLAPSGCFLNAEFVRAADPQVQARYWELWIQSMRDAGLTEAEVAQALERTAIDILATVEEQLAWLSEAGFTQVDCHFKDQLFAVFGGRRP